MVRMTEEIAQLKEEVAMHREEKSRYTFTRLHFAVLLDFYELAVP
jgi:hypothetical protein